MQLRKSILVAFTSFYLSSAYAAGSLALNDEGPFIGGVFSRPAAEAVQIAPAPTEAFESPPLFDKEGNSNSVIVLLDLGDRGDQEQTEEAILEAINAKAADTSAFFAEPAEAHHLIRAGRLDTEARALLGANDPEERLQRYIVLRYLSINAASAAVKQLVGQKGVLLAAMDKRLDFLWAPNDPYFPIDVQSAGHYQWGMQAMNFPSAWAGPRDTDTWVR